jgi:hypothetical protein
MSFICDICNTKTSTRYNLGKHKQSETCQKIKREQEQLNKINELTKKNKEQEEFIDNYKKIINENNLTIISLENKVKILENKVKTLEELSKKDKEKSEEYRKIIEKAATKSSKIVNNNNKNTYTHNNYLNYISQEPLKFSEIQQKINKFVTPKTMMLDNDDFNDHITVNILKDEKGKDKVLCTDINRKNFTYKDETSGKLISDPELEKLREQLVKSSNNQSLRKDLLDKLIKKYEGTETDPYLKFAKYIQNIDFGQPFVEHVAKKTYVKTKVSEDNTLNFLEHNESNEHNENNENNESNEHNENNENKSNEKNKLDKLDKLNFEDINNMDNQELDKLYEEFKDLFNE